MSFIRVSSGPHIGDTVILKKTHKSTDCTIKKGVEVQIVGFGPGGFDIRDNSGHTMIACGWKL